MNIGVFDSGIGGRSVANAIARALPEHRVIFRNDPAHVPYGTRPVAQIYELCLPVLHELAAGGAACIVIACNTVSTNLLPQLQQQVTVPLIGMEPMVAEAAAKTRSGVIAVCATPATLASLRYQQLKSQYARDIEVIEPDCSSWATMIEGNKIDQDNIASRMQPVIKYQADVIVLGCTHYHWIEDEIYRVVNGYASVLQPEPAIIRRVQAVLTGSANSGK